MNTPQANPDMQTETTSTPTALAEPATCNLQPSTGNLQSIQAVTVIDAMPLTVATPAAGYGAVAPRPIRKARRKGRVASLPKVQREMVNRMLWNGVPYKNIVAALGDAGFTLIDRNISSWATGGYLEWRFEQEAVLDNRLDQDHLLDFLRRDDASELPEVGLQAAATRLSQILLQKLAQGHDPEANLDNYTRLIDLVCRLNREISTTQQLRDNTHRALSPAHNPARIKDHEHTETIEAERFLSDPPSDAKLPKPAVPP